MVRAECFRALAKIDPGKSAKYVLHEIGKGNRVFVIYAFMALKNTYGFGYQDLLDNVNQAFDRGGLVR